MTGPTLLVCGVYTFVGFGLWELALSQVQPGDDALMACERYGARSASEGLAFLIVKGLFVALWPPCLVVYVVAQSYLRLRIR